VVGAGQRVEDLNRASETAKDSIVLCLWALRVSSKEGQCSTDEITTVTMVDWWYDIRAHWRLSHAFLLGASSS
jgi:hypothetical protein